MKNSLYDERLPGKKAHLFVTEEANCFAVWIVYERSPEGERPANELFYHTQSRNDALRFGVSTAKGYNSE